jgi:hypothetical protein
MNSADGTTSMPATLNLPDLHQAVLDTPTLERLLRDIEEHAQVNEIIPKFTQRGYVPEGPVTLAEARELLLFQSARGVQIRYRYEGADWWDTIMTAPEGFRLVRIRHSLDQPGD